MHVYMHKVHLVRAFGMGTACDGRSGLWREILCPKKLLKTRLQILIAKLLVKYYHYRH